ncbi:hypothetical protein LTR36_003109 [Oleoguttula mirabilis]|uniref:Uncharacterized protein n=1 Tax=Oleoguttula mirabilis TaxID=1507867 RepID=A0AAV9JWL3_9PEZI|nr:hypothetical protein LTR36_003109 [Oleoguttula mirabilis]
MDESPLCRLPPELRNIIYELVFPSQQPFVIFLCTSRGLTQDSATLQPNPLGLALTCKLTYKECRQLFYVSNRFILQRGAGSSARGANILRLFRNKIGAPNSDALRSVTIDVGTRNSRSWPYNPNRWSPPTKPKIDGILEDVFQEAKSNRQCSFVVQATLEYDAYTHLPRTASTLVERQLVVRLGFGDHLGRLWDATFDDLKGKLKNAQYVDDVTELKGIFDRLLTVWCYLGDDGEVAVPW